MLEEVLSTNFLGVYNKWQYCLVPTLKSEEKAKQKPETGRPIRREHNPPRKSAGWGELGEGRKRMIAAKWERKRLNKGKN